MIGNSIRKGVEAAIQDYPNSRLSRLVTRAGGPYAIKFVQSSWADTYSTSSPLKISSNPALTWGTATYVTPLAFPLSSALYGRIGVVTDFDPGGWSVFDATDPAARMAYVNWVRAQPSFSDLVLTVHSTYANHYLRNKFREDFKIDCVLFNPDQEAELHTDRGQDVWMAVTDWMDDTMKTGIDSGMSRRLRNARFTVLLDEEFALEANGLPINRAARQIENVTQSIGVRYGVPVGSARLNPAFSAQVIQYYLNRGYIHIYITP